MSDAFLPGNGFDTYETQDKVLVSMDGTVDCGVVVRYWQQTLPVCVVSQKEWLVLRKSYHSDDTDFPLKSLYFCS